MSIIEGKYHCDFCTRSEGNVDIIVKMANRAICGDCVMDAHKAVKEFRETGGANDTTKTDVGGVT